MWVCHFAATGLTASVTYRDLFAAETEQVVWACLAHIRNADMLKYLTLPGFFYHWSAYPLLWIRGRLWCVTYLRGLTRRRRSRSFSH